MSTNHNLSEEKGEPKQYRTERLPLTSLTPYRQTKPAHASRIVVRDILKQTAKSVQNGKAKKQTIPALDFTHAHVHERTHTHTHTHTHAHARLVTFLRLDTHTPNNTQQQDTLMNTQVNAQSDTASKTCDMQSI